MAVQIENFNCRVQFCSKGSLKTISKEFKRLGSQKVFDNPFFCNNIKDALVHLVGFCHNEAMQSFKDLCPLYENALKLFPAKNHPW